MFVSRSIVEREDNIVNRNILFRYLPLSSGSYVIYSVLFSILNSIAEEQMMMHVFYAKATMRIACLVNISSS